FVDDLSPDAFTKVVDRLLASPHYGERWGRHCLDVARYADTKGYVYGDREESRFPFANSYRDCVVRAFNQVTSYDPFPPAPHAAPPRGVPGRLPGASGRAALPGRAGVLSPGPAVPGKYPRQQRRPPRRGVPWSPGADRWLRPLPRPQVRPDPNTGLLLALRGV